MFSVGSQSSAPGSFDDENVSINFFHKTVKEFLASQYLECSGEVRFSSFCSSCSSLQSVMELLNILKFSVGLQPNLGSTVSETHSTKCQLWHSYQIQSRFRWWHLGWVQNRTKSEGNVQDSQWLSHRGEVQFDEIRNKEANRICSERQTCMFIKGPMTRL